MNWGTDGVAFLEGLREQGVSLPFVLFRRTAETGVASRAVAADVDRYRPDPAGGPTAPVSTSRTTAPVTRP